MLHIEDLPLAQHQRLHLIEVDGRTFLVHAGKGHAASFIAVDGTMPVSSDAASSGTAPRRQAKQTAKKSAAAPTAKRTSSFAAAIAEARRNNPRWSLANEPMTSLISAPLRCLLGLPVSL